MAKRTSEAVWRGNLKDGDGTLKLDSGAFEGAFTYASRFEEGEGTNPEELIGAAHAGCFSQFLAAVLSGDGYTPTRIRTTSTVHLGQVNDAPTITKIEINTEAEVPGVDEDTFMKHAQNAKENCPVSKALAGPEITMNAKLVS